MRINIIRSGYMGKQISTLLTIIGFDVLIWQKNYNNLNDDIKKIYSSDLKKTDPLKLINRIGVDTCLNILINLNKYDNQYYVPKMLQESVDLNILGNKNKTQFKIL